MSCGVKWCKNWYFHSLFLLNSVVVVSFSSLSLQPSRKRWWNSCSHKINQYSLRSHSFSSQRQASVLTRRDQTKRQSASATVVPASRSLHKHSMSTSAPFPSSLLSSSPWLPKDVPSWRHLFHFIPYFVKFKFILDSNNISNCTYNR